MTRPAGLPLVHLVLGLAAGLALIIGGTATFGSWGTIGVRLAALYVLGAIGLHAISRRAGRHALWLRSGAWLLLVAMALHTRVLGRTEVIVPLLALAAVDVSIHRTQLTAPFTRTGLGAKLVAALATLVAVGLVGLLLLLARDALVLARLGSTVLVGWALVTLFALRAHARGPAPLLGAAGAFSATFLFLAAPVIPFGPLLAYWILLASVALAVVTSSVTHTASPLDPEKRRHAQRVHPMPDPVLAPLREDVRKYLATGEGGRALSQRIEHALGRDEGGSLVPSLAAAQGKGTRPSRADRTRALAELLSVEAPARPAEVTP